MRAVGLQQVREQAKGPAATKRFAALLPKLPPDAQAGLLDALGDRGDKAARPALLDMLKSRDEPVRAAALRALGSLGEPDDVPLLAQSLAGRRAGKDGRPGEPHPAARASRQCGDRRRVEAGQARGPRGTARRAAGPRRCRERSRSAGGRQGCRCPRASGGPRSASRAGRSEPDGGDHQAAEGGQGGPGAVEGGAGPAWPSPPAAGKRASRRYWPAWPSRLRSLKDFGGLHHVAAASLGHDNSVGARRPQGPGGDRRRHQGRAAGGPSGGGAALGELAGASRRPSSPGDCQAGRADFRSLEDFEVFTAVAVQGLVPPGQPA